MCKPLTKPKFPTTAGKPPQHMAGELHLTWCVTSCTELNRDYKEQGNNYNSKDPTSFMVLKYTKDVHIHVLYK